MKPKNFLRDFFDAIIYFIYPPLCPVCREIADEYGELCKECADKVFAVDSANDFPPPIKEVVRITKYREGTRQMILRLKFEDDLKYLPAFHKILEESFKQKKISEMLEKVDLATSVPLHEKRLKERGYNQTDLIFEDWLKRHGVPFEKVLTRNISTPHLYKLNPEERKKVLNGVFSIADNFSVVGKKILIVDDIYTTGATAAACGKVLKEAGAAEIFVLAFASDF